jgi:hypothetical protein
MTDSEASAPWFIDHLNHYVSQEETGEEAELVGRAMALFHYATHAQTVFPLETTFPNDLAASACMNRAFRQLEATTVLLGYGFYAEIRNLLRSVYESVGLGRTLAKEPDMADKWLRKDRWWPDRVVRKWLSETRFVDDVQPFQNYYKEGSAWAHPTAKSCLPGFEQVGDVLVWDDAPSFDPEVSRQVALEIAATALFASFAFRNAVVDESAIDPEWRRDLYGLAEKIAGEPIAHLERNWEEEQRRYEAIMARVREAEDAEEVLRTHPRSWNNIR